MYFRPKIFISSTFELSDLRAKIKGYFESVGAEAILYEKDLTPSINIATYRQDIKEADFVIFIFNETYGTKTGSGKSGTHEEWDITKESKIPKHVYLKKIKNKLKKDQKEFIDKELGKENISYYYYDNNNDLMKQIKKMTFTVARDIAINKIYDQNLEEKIIKKLAIDSDYKKALDLIRDIDLIKNLNRLGLAGFIDTSIINDLIGNWKMYFVDNNYDIFIDKKLNESFIEVYNEYNKFIDIHSKSTLYAGQKYVFYPQRKFEYVTSNLKLAQRADQNKIDSTLKKFLDACNKFEKYLFEQKSNFEKKSF